MRTLVAAAAADSHKGDYGHVLVVAGSRGQERRGAPAAMGALRSGAGLVTVATPARCQPIVAAMAPEYMTRGAARNPTRRASRWRRRPRCSTCARDVIAIGPGLGTAPGTVAVRHALLERAGVPLVLDADALNAFAEDPDRLAGAEGRDVIITPHPGEMARLVGVTTEEVQANRVELARDFAATHQCYVVLKGHRTMIATPDGHVFINPTGNPGWRAAGWATCSPGSWPAGSAQLLDAEAACKLGVYLHGAAGDLAEAAEGEVALTASDLLAHLGDAVLELTARKRTPRPPPP